MKLLEQDRKKMVRIIIGECETGKSGIKAPTKTITLQDTNLNEVFTMVFDAIQMNPTKTKEQKKQINKILKLGKEWKTEKKENTKEELDSLFKSFDGILGDLK